MASVYSEELDEEIMEGVQFMTAVLRDRRRIRRMNDKKFKQHLFKIKEYAEKGIRISRYDQNDPDSDIRVISKGSYFSKRGKKSKTHFLKRAHNRCVRKTAGLSARGGYKKAFEYQYELD